MLSSLFCFSERSPYFSQESENSIKFCFQNGWEQHKLFGVFCCHHQLVSTEQPPMISVSVSMTPPILLNRFSRIRTVLRARGAGRRTQQSAGIYLLEIGRQQRSDGSSHTFAYPPESNRASSLSIST